MQEEYPEVVTADGEVLTDEQIRFAYSREGRRVIGKEYPNPVPMEPPIGFVPMKPLHEQIRDMVQREMSVAAEAAEMETAEEADDFDIGDDYDPTTPYEVDFEPTNPWPGTPAVEAAEQAAIAAAKKSGGDGGPSPPSDAEAAPPPPAEQS